jgi:acetyl esterase/lipase
MQHAQRRLRALRRPLSAALLLATASFIGWAPAVAADKPATPQAAAAPMAKTGTRYQADADMQAVLGALAGMGGKPIESLTPEEARKQPTPTDAVMAVLKKQGKDTSPTALVPGVTSVDQTIPGPAGPLPVRIYTPEGAGPFPVVVYFHGGGWVLADKNVYDGGARGLAKQADAVVVSVDYRLAPEAKFPAQHDDALATYKWAAANAASIKGDPKRLALAGESAGGNLAVATAMAARDQKLTAPLHVAAVYPIAQASDLDTPSYRDSATAKPLNKAMMAWFADKVFSTPEQKKDPRIDLVHADLAGLPPVTLINARIDPLRSDGDMLAASLKKAGVKVEHKVFDGVTHEFFGMAAVVAKARQAQAFAGQQLKKAFGATGGA